MHAGRPGSSSSRQGASTPPPHVYGSLPPRQGAPPAPAHVYGPLPPLQQHYVHHHHAPPPNDAYANYNPPYQQHNSHAPASYGATPPRAIHPLHHAHDRHAQQHHAQQHLQHQPQHHAQQHHQHQPQHQAQQRHQHQLQQPPQPLAPSSAKAAAAAADHAQKVRRARLLKLRKTFFDAPLIENKYTVKQIVGEGASGVVSSAIDNTSGLKVAVKRISRGFNKVPVSVRILRELKFLRFLRGHDNIVEIKDILQPDIEKDFDDVFIVMEFMPTDLGRVLGNDTLLSHLHIQFFMYQLLRGVFFLHSSGVFHRDLKPNNILLNDNCELRICDFGLARAAFDNGPDFVHWTDYVATRWYRAPELISTHYSHYSTAIDVWSVGCIFAEMLGQGKHLFPGGNATEQLQLMTSIIGSPSDAAIDKFQSSVTRNHFRRAPYVPRRPFTALFPDADELACDLLHQLLDWDPERRLSAEQALSHPYFKNFYQPGREPAGKPVDPREFDFERAAVHATPDDMRRLFLEEISLYHPQYRDRCLRSDFGRRKSGLATESIGASRASAGQLIPDRSSSGFERPSQADAFKRGMRTVEEGIKQRKSTSLPKSKLEPLNARYRERRRDRMAEEGVAEAASPAPDPMEYYDDVVTVMDDEDVMLVGGGVDVFARESLDTCWENDGDIR